MVESGMECPDCGEEMLWIGYSDDDSDPDTDLEEHECTDCGRIVTCRN